MHNGDLRSFISPIKEVIGDAKQGKMFILVDDSDRENEGDIVILAEHVRPEHINFMITHCKGLVCLCIMEEMQAKLGLELTPRRNVNGQNTAYFTTPIEACNGVTTGISAEDRALTIQVAVRPTTKASDLATPGHVFPIVARSGGLIERSGHTEASVEIAKICGNADAAVICEIIKPDGSMGRLDYLGEFAKTHGLRIGMIKELVTYVKDNMALEKAF